MADTSWRRALSEDEIPAAFRNVYGDRSETPLSVQMADVGVEFTPAGTIFGINDIKEELQKEEPDYYKIGMMAGIEAIGIIPGLGDAAIAAIKAGAKKVGLDKVADQTGALLSSPKAEDAVKNEMAGFTGQNPPTYIPKDEPPFDPDGIYETKDDIVRFREPIAEFTRKLTMANSFPSKGMTGAEFLRLLEKNAESIPPSSYKEGLVDKDKRYTREQLLDAVTKSPRGLPESIYYNLADLNANPAYQGYQRQSEVGFTGYPTASNSYFSIPILSRTSGNTFKANSQHFDSSTTAHVRGSFVDSMVGYDVNKTLSPRFKSIIGREDKYLLVEEIQSDLLQKGYRKPKNSFDTAFDKAANEAMIGTQTTFQEVYGDVTNELKSLIKTLEAKNIVMPEEPVRLQLPFRTGVLNHPVYKERRRRDFLDELRAPERGVVDGSNLVNFEEVKDYIDKQGVNSSHIYQILNDIELSANATRSFNPFESVSFVGPNGKVYNDIIVRSQDSNVVNNKLAPYTIDQDSPAYSQFLTDFEDYTKQFGLSYEDLLDKYEDEITKYYDAIDVEIEAKNLDTDLDRSFITSIYDRFLEIKKDQKLLGDETNTALPPVRKNKQTVEEALKLLIAKADQEGVDKIVIPPASKIAEARGRTIDPSDKGDRFYRTYVVDLNKALEDLEKNYPVTIHRDVELPYRSQNEIDNAGQAAANAADDAAINDDDLFTVEEGNQFFDLPEGFFDDVPDQNAPVQESKTKINTDNKGIIIDISKLREQFQVDKPRQFAEGGSPRPKLRPGSDRRISPKPRLRPDPERQYGLAEVEARADFDPAMHWNPIARLGFTGFSSDKTGKGNEIFPPAFYFPSTMPKKRAIERAIANEIPYDKALTVEPDDIYIAPELANKRVWAHEMTHRGFDRIIESINAHPEGPSAGIKEFKGKYGDDTFRLLTARTAKSHEGIVEMFDDLEDSVLRKAPEEEYLDDSSVDEIKRFQRTIKRKPEDRWQINKDKYRPYIKLMEAAQDMLTKAGEPPKSPDYEESILDKLRIKLGFAEGGTVDMNQQMSFAFEDGGLRDDGMTTDPVSGNEVPPGSTAKEVRDDIPAQLSEGEYVVPADVVRYYGVKFFEDLRDNAKMGLQDMEARGRIGGEPVPAGGPMADDLSPEEMAAIQEMMGMAEGGVVNMYKQQQELYTSPNPAIGNPTTGMAAGGEVRGYNSSSVVTNPMTDQSVLQAGQQAQQRGFVGFPLGATIFPSATTGQTVLGPAGTQTATTTNIGNATTGTTGTTATTDTSALTTVTLYGPNGEILTLTLPTDTDRYNQLLSEGWTTEMPVAGSDRDSATGTKTGPDTDPNSWMDNFDYNDFDKLKDQTSENLTKIPFGGVIGTLSNATKAAQSAANIIVMKANGFDTADLEKELGKFKKETGLNLLPNELINGDRLALDIIRNNPGADLGIDKSATDLEGNFIFKSKDAWDDFMQEVAPPNMTYNPTTESYVSDGSSRNGGTLIETTPSGVNVYQAGPDTLRPVLRGSSTTSTADSGPSTQAERTAAANTAVSNLQAAQQRADAASGSDDIREQYEANMARAEASRQATAAIREASGWGTDNYNPDWRNAAEGGLMTAEKPKKKRGRPKKSGLAGKK